MNWLAGGMAIALAVLPACAQKSRAADARATAQRPADGEVLREIVDPATGNCWLLERQAGGAPGRMVLAPAEQRSQRSGGTKPPQTLIRAGERVTLIAHTAVMDAELEGTALNSARAGAELRIRLKIGGRIVRALAIAPGHAQWAPEREEDRP